MTTLQTIQAQIENTVRAGKTSYASVPAHFAANGRDIAAEAANLYDAQPDNVKHRYATAENFGASTVLEAVQRAKGVRHG